MKNLLILILALTCRIAYSQPDYKNQVIFVINDSLTLYNVGHQYNLVSLVDIKQKDWRAKTHNEIEAELNFVSNERAIMTQKSISKTVMDIFMQVLTIEELKDLLHNSRLPNGDYFTFVYYVDKDSKPFLMKTLFSSQTSLGRIDMSKIGLLYKLMYEIKFNIQDCGLTSYGMKFDVSLKDVVNGTLNLDKYSKPRL